jgi:hypothetical protein
MVPVFFAYFFYLVFDAYKTAHALELGQPVPDPFGFERMFGPTPHPRIAPQPIPTNSTVPPAIAPAEPPHSRSSVPTGAVILIVLGLIFLLHTVGLFEFGINRFWPLILIGFGGWLFARHWGLLGQADGACTCDRCKMRYVMWPAVMVTVGLLIQIHILDGPSVGRTWPLILLVIGGVKLLQSNASDAGHIGGPPVLPPAGTAPPPPAAPPVDNTNRPPSEVSNV